MDRKRLLQDLIDGLSVSRNIRKKEAEDFVRYYFDTIQQALLSDRMVKVTKLGTLKLVEVEARSSVNVNTGEAVVIPEHLKISFQPETAFKEAINKPFAHFEPIETPSEKETTQHNTLHSEQAPVETPPITTHTPYVEPQFTRNAEEDVDDEPVSEPVEQPNIQDLLEHLTTNEHTMKPKPSHRPVRTYLLVVSGILIIAGLTYWSIVSNQSAKKDISKKLKLIEAFNDEEMTGFTEEPVLIENPDVSETLAPETETTTDKTDSGIRAGQTPATASTNKGTGKAEQAAVKRSIPSNVIIGPGDRLTKIALTYYGHKVYWVYIYMENKDNLPNPNDIPVGTTIRLPEIHPVLMDPNNAQSIEKAEALQDRIIEQLQSSRSK